MEDRLARARRTPEDEATPGAALIAFAVILVITAAWWALALWPVGAAEPEWLARTRAACFGAAPGGFPNAGGWVLLVGEPLGMLAVLGAIFGRALRCELRWIGARRGWRWTAIVLASGMLAGTAALAVRVSRVWAAPRVEAFDATGAPRRIDLPAPSVRLIDQHGTATALSDFAGGPVLLTFAYAHCTTVCPAIVHELLVGRRAAHRSNVPLVIITVDPWRDTPDRLPTIAAEWGLAPGDRVLSGNVTEVSRVLDALGVARARDETSGDVAHSAAAMLLDGRGHIAWRVDGGAQEAAALVGRL